MLATNTMLSAVIDTSVFVRGLLSSPVNREVVLSLRDSKFNLVISAELFDELLDVVTRPKFRSIFIPEAVNNLLEIIRSQAKFVNPRQKVTACRDIKDQKILECALEGADLIVSNDTDLLILKTFRSVPIITPSQFLVRLKK